MKILKFGGSSVGAASRIESVISIIKKAAEKDQVHVVVSAFQGVTDQLIVAANLAVEGNSAYQTELETIEKRHIEMVKALIPVTMQSAVFTHLRETLNNLEDLLQGIFLIRELSQRSEATVVSYGEQLSAYIISKACVARGLAAGYTNARELIITDSNYLNGRVLWPQTETRVKNRFDGLKEVQIITGFIASTEKGETTVLGRGGSDYTASVIGSILKVDVIQIWTDVDGVMTANPKQVTRAFSIDKMTYEEALEMSHFGAKVIYAPTMLPAMKSNIPISIHNTFNPNHAGTLIQDKASEGYQGIRGISSVDEVALLKIQGSGLIGAHGTAGRLFTALAKRDVNVILITQASSEYSICFAVSPADANDAREAVSEEFATELGHGLVSEISVQRDLSVIAVVGDHMQHTPGVAAKVFQGLAYNGINIVAIAQGSSERNISAIIDKRNVSKALNVLHGHFFLAGIRSVNLYMVGTGLIGSAVLEMIQNQYAFLAEKYLIDVRLSGVINSRKMILSPEGIALDSWKEQLNHDGEKADIQSFIARMNGMNLPNSIFIDCTASEQVSRTYPAILSSSISVVTPNKKANSTSQTYWRQLQDTALRHNVKFLYETNVGAGLPVVETIRHQMSTGDRIQRIEGILSGTLSYLFNSYDGSESFSTLLKKAKELGYTEPDPRDDLNGHDVARKLLILARESGFELEFKDIELQNLVPEAARSAESVDEFFDILGKYDAEFGALLDDANNEGKVLRYVARFEPGKAVVKLEKVDRNHPFYHVRESDNIIVIHSDHYNVRPMVISGPGAGASVTAAGVISDILRIARYAAT